MAAPIMVTVTTVQDQLVSLTVDANETVENLKALLEVETGLPLAQQRLIHNGRELQNNSTLGASGVANGDLLMLMPTQAMQPAPAAAQGMSENSLGMRADGSAVNPMALKVRLVAHLSPPECRVRCLHELGACEARLGSRLLRPGPGARPVVPLRFSSQQPPAAPPAAILPL